METQDEVTCANTSATFKNRNYLKKTYFPGKETHQIPLRPPETHLLDDDWERLVLYWSRTKNVVTPCSCILLYSCNAPVSMRQVSASYSPLLPCHVLACCILPCHHLHFVSCHHVRRIGICVRFLHPSIFPVVRFVIRHSYVLRCSPFVSCCERVLNVLGMDRGLPSGLGIAPIDRVSSFVPFGVRLIPQRLTGEP